LSATRLLFAFLLIGSAAPLTRSADTQSAVRPLVYIEADPNGTRYVRVMEQSRTAFAPARAIENLPTSGRINIRDERSTLVRNVTVRNARYGVFMSSTEALSIDNFTFIGWNGEGGIHGAAIKLNVTGAGPTWVQRVFADGQERPDASYRRSNTDFIGIERGVDPTYVRYATGRNFGDAGVDAKSNVQLMNVTINGAHRGLRAWSNAEITIVNSIVNVPPGHEQVWLQDATSRVRYHNVLWCIGAANPSPNARECSTAPTAIGADRISAAQARQRITALSSNPLPALSPFFASRIDRIVIESSSNGGASWQVMATGGAPGRAPYGDTRYRIPFNLNTATYLFRVRFERNGGRVGVPVVVNEAGRIIGS
jgi:hypothetical protein